MAALHMLPEKQNKKKTLKVKISVIYVDVFVIKKPILNRQRKL